MFHLCVALGPGVSLGGPTVVERASVCVPSVMGALEDITVLCPFSWTFRMVRDPGILLRTQA